MERIDRAIADFRSMDGEAREEGFLQNLHPLSKFFVTVLYLVILLSFHRYDLSGVLLMGVYPVLMFTLGDIPVMPMWRRMALILIPVSLVGIANPFFDTTPVSLNHPAITGGMVSMVTLLLKGLFAVAATYLLMVTTTMDGFCSALRKLRVPAILVTVIMLLHRYIIVFLEEVSRMRNAYLMRAPGQKGIYFKVWGPMTGMMLLRSIDKSETVYQGMTLRGFNGGFGYVEGKTFRPADAAYLVLCIVAFLLIRYL